VVVEDSWLDILRVMSDNETAVISSSSSSSKFQTFMPKQELCSGKNLVSEPIKLLFSPKP
jgi:hypothetical protein